MNFSELPEIYKYAKLEAPKSRLIAGFLTTTLVCLCIFFSVKDPVGTSGFFTALLTLQTFLLLLYGTLRTSGSIATERSERTWDLQRMTPLTSFQIAAGKLIGAPLFAYFIFVVSLPWAVLALFISDKVGLDQFLSSYGLLAANVFLFLNLGLLISAYSDKMKSSSVTIGGAFVGFYGLSFFTRTLFKTSAISHEMASFYGVSLPKTFFAILTSFAFGWWAFAGARWRLGEDLLERKNFWRLPLFLFFLAWFVFGVYFGNDAVTTGYTTLFVCSLFALISSLLNKSGADHWRYWLFRRQDKDWLNQTPVWIIAWLSVTLISFLLAIFCYSYSGRSSAVWQAYVLIPAFLLRDLSFLQWCRFTKSRRPEMMALLYILLSYVLPMILLNSFKSSAIIFIFVPYVSNTYNPWWHVIPGVGQGVLMATIAIKQLERYLKTHH